MVLGLGTLLALRNAKPIALLKSGLSLAVVAGNHINATGNAASASTVFTASNMLKSSWKERKVQ